MVFFTDFFPAVRTGILLLFLTVREETEEENDIAEGGLGRSKYQGEARWGFCNDKVVVVVVVWLPTQVVTWMEI